MTTVLPPICSACKRFRFGKTCAAFPVGIPDEIWQGRYDHRKAFPGDHGTRFVRDPEQPMPEGFPEHLDVGEPVKLADPGVIRHQTKRDLRETAKRIIDQMRD